MAESRHTRLQRWRFNFFPAYRGAGARITYIAADWREVRIKLPLNWLTRNYVGTIYGGSMYGAVDPIYMIMLIHLLGPDYVVWDKAATIRFKRPGRTTLVARFVIDEAETWPSNASWPISRHWIEFIRWISWTKTTSSTLRWRRRSTSDARTQPRD